MITSDLIKEEIRLWSKDVLEKPSANFKQMPPCPYAQKAWKNDKVKIHVTDDLTLAVDIKENNPPKGEEVEVIAWTGWKDMDVKEFDRWINKQNKQHNGTWIIGFHPDHPEDENIEEFEGNGSPEYGMILVQSHSHLAESSKKILTKGYYQKYSKEDMNHVIWRNSL